MERKSTTFASESARTILPRKGIGAERADFRPTTPAYNLEAIPVRGKPARVPAQPFDAVPNSKVHPKQGFSARFRRKPANDPFIDRLSRLS